MIKKLKGCFSHNTDDWRTPKDLYNYFIKKNGFLDLFSYKMEENQFEILYKKSKLYINPPFSKLKDIPIYIYKLLEFENEIVLLMPARTDTKYFHELLKFNPKIYFIKGRLHFNDSKNTAPFPTILLHFNNYKFCEYSIFKYEEEFLDD